MHQREKLVKIRRLASSHFVIQDPRVYQIAVLGSLLVYGIAWLDFEMRVEGVVLVLSAVLLTQYTCTRIWRLPVYDPRSPLISGLSLCLLLRTNSSILIAITGAITIVSKFVFRLNGKHIFNPTNFGLIAMMLLTDQVWVSPGQWGNDVMLAFLIACLGSLVITKASRSDITFAFLGFYAALLIGRSWWLGEPMSIPLHRLQNGALLLFSFFMISDPKTTPNSRFGRILFALLVACGAGFVHFVLFRPNGLLWSLAALSPAGPLLDRFLPGPSYEWPRTYHVSNSAKGEGYEAMDAFRSHIGGSSRTASNRV